MADKHQATLPPPVGTTALFGAGDPVPAWLFHVTEGAVEWSCGARVVCAKGEVFHVYPAEPVKSLSQLFRATKPGPPVMLDGRGRVNIHSVS